MKCKAKDKLLPCDALAMATSGGICHKIPVVSSWRLCKVTAACPFLQRSCLLTAGHGQQVYEVRGAALLALPFVETIAGACCSTFKS